MDDEYCEQIKRIMSRRDKELGRKIRNHVKSEYNIDIGPDIIGEITNNDCLPPWKLPEFDDHYTEGGCIRVKKKGGSKSKFKYCGNYVETEYFCNYCRKNRKSGIKDDLELLTNGSITIEQIRERNRRERMGKRNITVIKEQNTSGYLPQIFSNIGFVTEPYTKVNGYNKTYVTKDRRYVFSVYDNEIKFLGVDVEGHLERNIPQSIVDFINSINDVDIVISNKINTYPG